MPNHVVNKLQTENPEHFQTLVDTFTKNNKVDFNLILPMPDCLYVSKDGEKSEVFNPPLNPTPTSKIFMKHRDPLLSFIKQQESDETSTDIEKAEKLAREVIRLVGESGPTLESDDARCVANIALCGHPTWFGWCSATWSTKWNAYGGINKDEKGRKFGHVDIENKTIWFETAWNSPFNTLRHLSTKLADITLVFNSANEDYNQGPTSIKMLNGELIEAIDIESEEDIFKHATKLWFGYDAKKKDYFLDDIEILQDQVANYGPDLVCEVLNISLEELDKHLSSLSETDA